MRTERSFARPGRYAGLWLLALWLEEQLLLWVD